MKLSFSTLGCPRWTWDEILSTAKDLGLDGIEIRGIGDKIFAPDIKAFSTDNIENTKAKLASLNIEISMLTSGAVLAVTDKAQASLDEAKAYIDLAAKLGTPYIRVMGTGNPQIEDNGDFSLATSLYKQLCEYAKHFGVTPLIETNGKLSDSSEMLKFMDSVNCDNCGVLWDIHHTVRFGGESPAQTFENIGKYIKHVHVKDSALVDGNIEYRMMGYGDIPIMESVSLLKNNGYNGYVSLEWVKRWNPDLQEPGIVFAHFNSYMRMLG